MRSNCALIVICAALCNIATSKSWHGPRWHDGPGSSSSASSFSSSSSSSCEDYDWPHYVHSHHPHHSANQYNPWGLDSNQYPQHNQDWSDSSDESNWNIFQRSTPRTSTSSHSQVTVFSNQPTWSSNTPTIFSSQPTLFSNTPAVFPSQSIFSSKTPTVFPSQSIFSSKTPTVFPSQPTLPSNTPTEFPSQPTLPPNTPTEFPSQPTLPSNTPTVFPSQQTLSSNTPSVLPNRPTQFPSEPTGNPNQQSLSDNELIDPNPRPTVQGPSASNTGSLLGDVETCQRSCIVTTEYDPVCGTNYETYTNMGRFKCAQDCGVDVQIFLRRSCPSIGVGTLKTTTVQCIASCPLTEEFNPVCGSDDITYDNPSQLLCAQMCGYNVRVKTMTSCSEVTTTQAPNLRLTSPIPYGVQLCTESCTSNTEFKPVCGTNDVTYQSQSHLECVKICGIDVEIKHKSPCGQINNDGNNNPTTPSINDQRVTPLPPIVQMCVNSCPVTADLNPVCGSNGITYFNPSQLECDQLCGIRVEIVQRGPCSQDTNSNQTPSTTSTTTTTTLSPSLLASCIRACPKTPEYNPVCGTNGVTYNNPSHLSCAQICGAGVDIKRRAACPPVVATQSPGNNQPSAPITNPPLQTTNEPTNNQNDSTNNSNANGGVTILPNVPTNIPNVNDGNKPTDNTISPAVLSIVTDAPTTTTEKDEFIDFDTRFGEDQKSKK